MPPSALGLSQPVGRRRPNRTQDVARLGRAFARLGYLVEEDRPEAAWRSEDIAEALGRFQRTEGLIADGYAEPGGESEQRLLERLGEQKRRVELAAARNAFLPGEETLGGDERLALLARLPWRERLRLLAEAGFDYEPDRLGRLDQGTWRDRDGRVLASAEVDAVPLETILRRMTGFGGGKWGEYPDGKVPTLDWDGLSATPSHERSMRSRTDRRSLLKLMEIGQGGRESKPSPHEESETTYRELADGVGASQANPDSNLERYYRGIARSGRALGYKDAADNLERHLDGKGGTKVYSRDEARKFEPIRRAEETIREYVVEKNFTDATGNSHDSNTRLSTMRDGDSVRISDKWDADTQIGEMLVQGLRDQGRFYTAFGRTGVDGLADLVATRRGDRIRFDGEVTFIWNDRYDFLKPQPYSAHMKRLEKTRGAKPFEIRARWKQRVFGSAEMVKGKIVNPRAVWSDLPSGADR